MLKAEYCICSLAHIYPVGIYSQEPLSRPYEPLDDVPKVQHHLLTTVSPIFAISGTNISTPT